MIRLIMDKAGNKYWVRIFSLMLFPLHGIKSQGPDPEHPTIYKVKCWNSLSSLPELLKRNCYSNRAHLLGNVIANEKNYSPIISHGDLGLSWHTGIFIKRYIRDLSLRKAARSFTCLTQKRQFNRALYFGYFCYTVMERMGYNPHEEISIREGEGEWREGECCWDSPVSN